ncbi:hypothetical protein CPAV1605_601 [seawater metagenome]|uniref:Uncharacterized protein n=1 Tax=seawater metagenome TaxID=1561972 RepID=A0A5E8CIH1_9ZZZZ
MNARYISLILLVIAIMCIVYSLTKAYNKCPKPKVEYRYINKTFEQQQNNPLELNKVFGQMFEQPSPWVGYSLEDSEMSDFENISQ